MATNQPDIMDVEAERNQQVAMDANSRAERLRARLYSYAPKMAPPPTNALQFRGVTKAQARRMLSPFGPTVEPLPSLQRYQLVNKPEYIQKKNLEALELKRRAKDATDLDDPKRLKRAGSVEPLEVIPPAPDLPQELKEKQETMVPRPVTPRDRGKSPVGKSHTSGPAVPTQAKMKFPKSYEGLRDMNQIIGVIRDQPKVGFLYMSPAVPKSSVNYHYYNLKVVSHEHLYKPDYLTISLKGVTRMRADDETEFVLLDRWEQEVFYFHRLIKIKTFALFRKWKAFSVWRKNVRTTKIKGCKKALDDNLFIVNPSLRPALLNVREMCHRISEMGLCQIDKDHTYTLTEFREAQFNQLNDVAGRLQDFRELVKEVVRSACRTALLEAGFTPDDYYYDGADSPGMYGDMGGAPGTASSYLMQSNYDMDIYGEAPEKMTYTEQANKRAHCKRLTCFIRLADYLIVNTMHVLAVNSVSTLLNYLSEQLQNTATLAEIQSYNDYKEEEEKEKEGKEEEKKEDKEEEEDSKLPPLFITEFVLEPNQLLFSPDLDDFQDGLAEVIKRFQDAVLSVQNLVPDAYFDAFTRPIINNKFEDKTCGEGPSLGTMFEDDKHLQTIIHNIREAITAAFNAASQYADTFEAYREFFKENEILDLNTVRGVDHDVQFFAD
ncbi:dynein heavy chain 6, axonemal, partial [Aplysia californica]|uniref:Dynein heavy chain 6, axonemal n=1 Tax=Aplysia californica TaxID=6500 RepID=A0ABM0K8H4_APLCA